MPTYSGKKLNRLQQEFPENFLADAAWLDRHGYSSSLRSQYVKAGWLNQPARRVYRRSHGPMSWEQVVTSLQALLDLPLTVGGRTALEAQGFAHYLGRGPQEVHLYGPERPPTWLKELPVDAKFLWHNSRRLFSNDPLEQRGKPSNPFDEPTPSLMPGGYMLRHGAAPTWPIRYSIVERAILELLDELPDRESFHQVDMLMEGLANLGPRRLQAQLQNCRSVKVKRLFFFFADRHQHAWLGQLDKNEIDLGAGKRALVKGGKLDRRYQITVPGDL
ncbi:MAG TPA: type IV toxin-antitoxin system AbiEi family antitoxin domain-containing protein [Allosphingosinicella sp.]|nr:type IV toxin-antitoxin system AbiEi family antitoxin domain-containing protein [Allosphingosinicella sp.]